MELPASRHFAPMNWIVDLPKFDNRPKVKGRHGTQGAGCQFPSVSEQGPLSRPRDGKTTRRLAFRIRRSQAGVRINRSVAVSLSSADRLPAAGSPEAEAIPPALAWVRA
jgi:hypothetical protein